MKNILFLIFISLFSCKSNDDIINPNESNQQVFINGKIYTVNENQVWATAMLIENGEIKFIGTDAEIQNQANSSAEITDLNGKFVMPSFVESHLHPLSTSYARNFTADLSNAFSHDEYIQIITDFANTNSNPDGFLGNGFATSIYGPLGPGKESLDAIDSDRPIAIISDDIHALWANSKALEIAGITASTPNPVGGIIVKDPTTGEPTGLLKEIPAMSLVWDNMSFATKAEYKTALLWGQQELNKVGITTAHDAWVEFDPNYYNTYNELANEEQLTVRFRGSWYIDPNADNGYVSEINDAQSLLQSFTHPHFKVNSFKFLADGTVEESTAWLTEPYSNQAGYYGIKNWEDSDIATAFSVVDNAGFQIHVHAIGDAATNYTLNAMEQLGTSQNRHSITHIQLISNSDITKMGQLNISAHIMPYWMVLNETYNDIYIPALGNIRANNTYPIKSMANAGINMTVGSDWPTSEPNPILAIYNGITRSNIGEGQLPQINENLTLEQMIKAVTINGAYANFLDDEIGTLEVGKKADFVILSQNLLAIDVESIPSTIVEKTYFEGKQVY